MSERHRVTAGPYSLDLWPNGRATLYMANGAGQDHEVPWGLDHLDALIQFAGEVLRLKAQLAQMEVDRRDGETDGRTYCSSRRD